MGDSLEQTESSTRGSSRPPLERMMLVHAQLKSGDFPNCRKIADQLEVSTKTIQRDIDFMRDRLGLPIEYDPIRFGFYYTEPVTSFPSIEVSEGEITALFVAQKALAQYKGTPFEKPLRSAFRKITDGLKDRVSFSWSELEDVISFRTAGATVADVTLFDTVSKAVLHSAELEFEYRGLKSNRYAPRAARPYHIASLENQWYLFAEDVKLRQLRTFALPRMRNVRSTDRIFRRPSDFSVTEVLSGSFGVFEGGKPHRIRLQFDGVAARLVGERVWHHSQKIKALTDGSIVLELSLGALEEIERWVLGWGKHVRILEPNQLRNRVRETAESIARMYAVSC
jgi:proteasome accessory factor B